MISVDALTFVRPKRPPVLEGVSLTVSAGDVLCVLGPNGAGKSTLLNCVLGIEQGWTGTIHLAGQDARSLSRMKAARLVAYVPQSSAAAFSFTVRQCVMMGRTPHIPLGGQPADADHEAVAAALAQVGVEALADRRYDELSGGERQLVLIARAVAQDTPIILMDEPTASLDLANQAMALRVIQDLARRGRAILMTTHLPEQAFLLDAKALLLSAGVASDVGRARTLCTRERLEALYGVSLVLLENEAGAACLVRL